MINKIYLLVHPLYDQCFPKDDIDIPRTDKATKEEKRIAKNELHNYGLMIQEAKRNPNALLLFVKLSELPANSPFANEYTRLLRYAKKELGDRIKFLPASFGYLSGGATRKVPDAVKLSANLIKVIPISKKVNIEYLGQAFPGCAGRSAIRLTAILEKRNISGDAKPRKGIIQADDMLKHLTASAPTNPKRNLTAFSKWRRSNFGKRQVRTGKR